MCGLSWLRRGVSSERRLVLWLHSIPLFPHGESVPLRSFGCKNTYLLCPEWVHLQIPSIPHVPPGCAEVQIPFAGDLVVDSPQERGVLVSLRGARLRRATNQSQGGVAKRATRLPRLLLACLGERLAMTDRGKCGSQGVERGFGKSLASSAKALP